MSIIDPNFSDEDEATPALFASAVKSGTLSAIWCDTQRGRGLRSHPPQTHNESLSKLPQITVIYFKALKKKRTGQTIVPRWDSASKNKQRQLIQQQRSWQKSTGPRTTYGRLVSSQNALKKKRSFLTDVSSVSHRNQEGDTDRPLQIGDRVSYIGGFQPTLDVCGGQPLKVVGLDEVAGAIACCTAFEKVLWIYPQDLERV